MSNTDHDIIDAAMCLWEACLELEKEHYVKFRDMHGAAETRDRVAYFAGHCHDAWVHAHTTLGYDEPFDWDWCPRWLDHCVDVDFDLVVIDCTTQAQIVMEDLYGKL
jgi:hypothetical protein